MNIFLAPHNDDEVLFACFTLIREKPLVVVVTDSYIQPNRGDKGCDAQTRRAETQEACRVLGISGPRFLGLRDDRLLDEEIELALRSLSAEATGRVYIPAVQGGNVWHDAIGKIGLACFPEAIRYTTYTKTELWTKGTIEVVPTKEENELKIKAMGCYQSQLNLPSTRPHFAAVLDKSEWLL